MERLQNPLALKHPLVTTPTISARPLRLTLYGTHWRHTLISYQATISPCQAPPRAVGTILETIRASALTRTEVQAIETGLVQLSLRMRPRSRVEALTTMTLELENAQLLLGQLQKETTKQAETTIESLNRLDDSTTDLKKKVRTTNESDTLGPV